MCGRVRFYSGIQGVEYKRIIIAVTNDKCNNSTVIQIQDGTQIHLVYSNTFIPLKLCHIRQPLLIRHTGMELTIQPVLCNVLWVGSLPCAAVILVLDGGLNVQTAANTKNSLFIHIQFVVVSQIILNTAVTFVGILGVDLLHNLRNLLIFQLSATLFTTKPAVVCCSGHTK